MASQQTIVVTYDLDEDAPPSPLDVLYALHPEARGDCIYTPATCAYTGDDVVRHVRLGVTVRRLG